MLTRSGCFVAACGCLLGAMRCAVPCCAVLADKRNFRIPFTFTYEPLLSHVQHQHAC